MKIRKFVIAGIVILVIALVFYFVVVNRNIGEKICPDTKYVNNMPRSINQEDVLEENVYFIVDGERRELRELNLKWVEKNCDVEVKEVW